MTEDEGEFKKRIEKTYDKEGFWFAQTPEEMFESLGIEDAKKEIFSAIPKKEIIGTKYGYSEEKVEVLIETLVKWLGPK